VISLTRLNGRTTAINPDLITWIDVTPDTTVSLLGGEKIIVRETLSEVIERVVAFRRLVGGLVRPPSSDVLSALEASQRRSSLRPERPVSARPLSITTIERK
jgi:flagellar protein FlbD